MIRIPDVIKDLFITDNVKKNFRVIFPNGEYPDMVNGKVESESVTLTESISSGSVIKFGLCESPMIEFICHGMPNFTRKTIKCQLEVDISSLSAEDIAQYGVTSADVPYPYYVIPYGTYIVKECKKSGDSDKRKVVGYSKLAYYDWDQFPSNLECLKYQTWKSAINITFSMEDMVYFYLPQLLENNLIEIQDRYGTYDRTIRSSTLDIKKTVVGDKFDTGNPLDIYWDIIDGELKVNEQFTYWDHVYVTCLYKQLNVAGMMDVNSYEVKQIIYKAITSESGYNRALNELNTYLKDQEYVYGDGKLILRECSNNKVYHGQINPEGIPFAPYFGNMSSNSNGTPIKNDSNTRFSSLPLYDDGGIHSFVRVNTYDWKYVEDDGSYYDTNIDCALSEYGTYRSKDNKTGEYIDNKTTHNVPSTILVLKGFRIQRWDQNGQLINEHNIYINENKLYGYRRNVTGTGVLTINSASEVVKVATDLQGHYRNRTDQSLYNSVNNLIGQKIDYRELVQSILEIQGKFGMIDRTTGDLKIIDLTDHLSLYPAPDLYPAQDLYPRGYELLITRNMYKLVEYEDSATRHYDRISCTWTDSSNNEHYQYYDIVDHDAPDYDPDDYQTYSLSENYFIKNKYYTVAQVTEILHTLGDKIKGFQYFPCDVECVGLPYVETGDGISVITKDSGFTSFVLRRTIKGIQSLQDNIEAR